MSQATTDNLITCINPANRGVLGQVRTTPLPAIHEVVRNARNAQLSWRKLSLQQRLQYIEQFRCALYERSEQTAETVTLETGKPRIESLLTEVFSVLETCKWLVHNAPKVLAPEKVSVNKLLMPGKKAYNVFEPLGVLAVISPWNYPFSIPLATMLTALAAGNAVVLKPSPKTALIAEAAVELFHRAGFPSGLVGLVQGDRAEAQELILGDVDRVSFTGSVQGGRAIMALAAKKLIPVTLELGGKHAAIVLKDSDIDKIAKPIVWSAFTNAGQACVSIERLYVEAEIADALVERVAELTAQLRLGDGLSGKVDVGPMIDEAQVNRMIDQVEDARAKGGCIVAGGRARPDLGGFFFEPTVISRANGDMKCVKDETFGPLLPIQVVKDAEEAIRLANQSDLGLGASIWTKDVARGEKLAREVQAGLVWVNDAVWSHAVPDSPWGGIKQSGFGRMHGAAELRDLVYCKTVGVNKQGSQDWNYPYRSSSINKIRGGMRLLHGGVMQKLSGMALVARSMVDGLIGK